MLGAPSAFCVLLRVLTILPGPPFSPYFLLVLLRSGLLVTAHSALNLRCTSPVLPPLNCSFFLHHSLHICGDWHRVALSKYLHHEIKWREFCEAHRAERRCSVNESNLYPPRPPAQQWRQCIALWPLGQLAWPLGCKWFGSGLCLARAWHQGRCRKL